MARPFSRLWIDRACALLLAGWVIAAGTVASAQVALVSRGPEDRAVLEQLAGMLDEPLSERPETEIRALGAIMDEARASWPERYVVVIDRESDSVHALRPSDRTLVSRVLSAELLGQSPYAVALAIAELLEWLGAAPRGASSAATPSSSAAAVPEPPQSTDTSGESANEEAGPSPSPIGLALSAGVELSGSPSADLSLMRLALGLEAQLNRGREPLWFALAARFAAPASLHRKLDPPLRTPALDAIEYESSELALQLALGLGQPASAIAFGPFFGLSPVHVAVLDDQGSAAAKPKETWAGFAGLGVRLRYPIAFGFAFDLSAEAELLFEPVRYRVGGRQVLDDGPMRAQTRLGVVWESAFSP